jgi:hypothetical protein
MAYLRNHLSVVPRGHALLPSHQPIRRHPGVRARLVPAQEPDKHRSVIPQPRNISVEHGRSLHHGRPKREGVNFSPDDGTDRVPPRRVPFRLLYFGVEDLMGRAAAQRGPLDGRLGAKISDA